MRFGRVPAQLEGITHDYWWAFPVPLDGPPRIDVALYEGRGLSAAWLHRGRVESVDEVVLTGPRMERWVPGLVPPDLAGQVPADGPFSRYIGALGGVAIHDRMRATKIACIGAARLGSVIAEHLARAGFGTVYLVDDDVFEAHSTDALHAFAGDVGRPKVDAAASFLERCAPAARVVPVRARVQDEAGLAALLASDLYVSAPDDNRARLVVSLLAAALHRVHVDIGTGVFLGRDAVEAGADVRLVVPGQGCCLLDAGGLDLRPRVRGDWQAERAGSLPSLNAAAAAQAMLLIERLFAGSLQRSTWLRLDVDARGHIASSEPDFDPDPACPVCALAGSGDAL